MTYDELKRQLRHEKQSHENEGTEIDLSTKTPIARCILDIINIEDNIVSKEITKRLNEIDQEIANINQKLKKFKNND